MVASGDVRGKNDDLDLSLEELKSIEEGHDDNIKNDGFDFDRDANDDEAGGEEPVELLRRGTT